ncbi:hypothetical protein LYSHEL_19590 [Lysobacter helvus]|uniref:Uncharacterized protein n=2 Tax=Lysobacteraceae TaxID=32033 RepID=A0ABM7Q6G1_9GAMM|nr:MULTISPECIES: hypothetical protein [Lysobacter]BCT92936.1 hypothetical protein LYSCAS_19600 [Lysobacter caseinilyticus]BCT96088.1 hypothetical protein LYSHEL_19590 [Lysobacter helvus]
MHRFGQGVAWALGSCAVAVVVAYLAVVAINWFDEPPSADAQALARITGDRPIIPDQSNAYILFLGLSAPLQEDPFIRGQERNRFLTRVQPWKAGDAPVYLPGREVQYKGSRTPAIAAIAEACGKFDTDSAECVRLVHADPAQVAQWLDSESWLLARYEDLVALRQWRERVPNDMAAPMPSFLVARDGQLLLLMQSWQHARAGQGDAARALLQDDLAFWRMVLQSSDTLITKMIATGAVERNLALGNLALRDLHAAGKPAAPPDAWQTPLSLAERSMQRPFAGEFRFQSGSLQPIADAFGTDRLSDWFKRPMLKVQATNNLSAARFRAAGLRFDADYPALPAAANMQAPTGRCDGLYNFVGCVLYGIGAASDDAQYALRVADLEGERRATLLAAELRAAGADATDLAQRVQASPLKNPYTGQPFEWDAANKRIVFTGMAKGTHARHAVPL